MRQAPDRPISAQPAAADVERDYPLWRTWVGVDRLCYGLPTQGAALTARGEDWLEEIRREEAMLEDSRPRAWA